jgi:hypothetical protein
MAKTVREEITEEPRFFERIPASKLEGISCRHCGEGFDPSIPLMDGYKAKVDAPSIRKGEIYHLGCRKYLISVANSGF